MGTCEHLYPRIVDKDEKDLEIRDYSHTVNVLTKGLNIKPSGDDHIQAMEVPIQLNPQIMIKEEAQVVAPKKAKSKHNNGSATNKANFFDQPQIVTATKAAKIVSQIMVMVTAIP